MQTPNIKEDIIRYLKRNRVSTTEVADCLDKTGAIPEVYALNLGHYRVGNAFYVYTWDESNWPVHEQILKVQEGDVVLVEAFNCQGRAIFGDLVSKYLMLYLQASAIVVLGAMRDVPRLHKENWPVWCTGETPIGCFNSQPTREMDAAVIRKQRDYYDGAIAVCDDCGVVVIPKEKHTGEFLKRLEFIEEQESIWYDCIDRRQWSTFDTVCLKKYNDQTA